MKLQTAHFAFILFLLSYSTLFSQQSVTTELKECKAIGKELHFNFLLTNNSEISKLQLLLADAKLYDGNGNVFTSGRIELGEKFKIYGSVLEECPKEIPIALKIVFKDAPSKLTDVTRLLFTVKEYGSDKSYSMEFTNVKVPTTKNDKVLKAFDDPYYFESEDGTYVRFIKAHKANDIITAEFTVENSNYDKKVSYTFNDTRIIDNLGNAVKVKSMVFGSDNKLYGSVSQNLPQNVPVKLVLSFQTTDPSASVIKVLELGTNGNVFQLRDIDL